MLLAMLLVTGQKVVYVPDRTVNRMAGAFRGEGKTDAKDARIIAETARMRHRDLAEITAPDELVMELSRLTPETSTSEKSGENRVHTQALLALARRLVDVLWALLRDNRTFTPAAPALASAA